MVTQGEAKALEEIERILYPNPDVIASDLPPIKEIDEDEKEFFVFENHCDHGEKGINNYQYPFC